MSNSTPTDHPSEENESGEIPAESIPLDASESEKDTATLPDEVPEGTLSGDVPHGEIPRLPLVIEAILFASQKAATPKELLAHLKSAATLEPNSVAAAFLRLKESDVREALDELQAEIAASGRAFQVRETATGWLLSSAPGFAPWLRALYPEAKPTRLSAPALETLAIIAYRQPIARADMEAVRGVAVDGVMQTLLDRGLVKIAGRAEVPGRPLLYATTQYFLDHFGLRHLDELPNASELRHIPLPKGLPEAGKGSSASDDQPSDGTPELPGVTEQVSSAAETTEITEIMEIREAVDHGQIAEGLSQESHPEA